jgi:hypothetical protein
MTGRRLPCWPLQGPRRDYVDGRTLPDPFWNHGACANFHMKYLGADAGAGFYAKVWVL